MIRTLTIATTALVLTACNAQTPAAADSTTPVATGTAVAALRTAAGADAGTASVTATSDTKGLTVAIVAKGLPAGDHGVHLHTVGSCDAPAFTTAGPHWNPTARRHGAENPLGPHDGDLPNLTIAANGTGALSYTIAGATLGGAGGLLDADGAAFVVHAAADDYRTDPSGNSGNRVACGVFSAG